MAAAIVAAVLCMVFVPASWAAADTLPGPVSGAARPSTLVSTSTSPASATASTAQASVVPVASSSPASASSVPGRQPAAAGNITDTQNLLGDNLSAVIDAITKTKNETGVTVKLLYVQTFTKGVKPAKWASDVLESTAPVPNTLMLAVASDDGNLVVAVSANSDAWLKSQGTVDTLSSAAQQPLMNQAAPDWSGSAIAMMKQISKIKQSSTTGSATVIGVSIFAGAIVVLAAVGGFIFVRRRRLGHARNKTKAQESDGRGSDTGAGGKASDGGGHGGHATDARPRRHSRHRRGGVPADKQ